MRRIVAILTGLLLTLAVQAQGILTFTTSGGLTIDVPDGYLVAEIAPQRVGLTNRETGASLVLEIVDADANPEDVMNAELRRLGAGQIQFPALEIRADNARIVTARGSRASGTVMVGQVLFTDGKVGILTILPADSAPRTLLRPLIASVRVTAAPVPSVYPACGSAELPQSITTSGGLSVCFPAGMTAEEKGANALGLADLDSGIIVSVYARADLDALLGEPALDASATVLAFGETLRASGATVFDSAIETLAFDGGTAAALPVVYPRVGSGRVIAAQTPDGVILLSAVLIGLPPADVIGTLDAMLNSASLGAGSDGLGVMQPASRVVNLTGASFTLASDWALIAQDNSTASVERADISALMSVASAPLDSTWNAETYKGNILAEVVGRTGGLFNRDEVQVAAQEDGVYTLETYEWASAEPDAGLIANLTAMLTLNNRALVVFQAHIPRGSFDAGVYDQFVAMALSAAQ